MDKYWFKAQKETSYQNKTNNSVFTFESNHLVPIEFDYELSLGDLGLDNLEDFNKLESNELEEAITQHLEKSLPDTKVEVFSYIESDDDSAIHLMESSDADMLHKHEDECMICRDDVCAKEFLIRLGGLTNGISQYLSRFVGCKISLELTDGKKIHAEIFCVREGMLEIIDGKTSDEPIIVFPNHTANSHFNSHPTQTSKHPVMVIPTANIKCFDIEKC